MNQLKNSMLFHLIDFRKDNSLLYSIKVISLNVVNEKEIHELQDEFSVSDKKRELPSDFNKELQNSDLLYEKNDVVSVTHSVSQSPSLSPISSDSPTFFRQPFSIVESSSTESTESAIATQLPAVHYSKHYSINPPYFSKKYTIKQVEFSKTDGQYTSSCPDITMVTQLSLNRIVFLKEIWKRWNGRISAALALSPQEYTHFTNRPSSIIPFTVPSRVSLTPYRLPPDQAYPVNLLRNLAIKNVTTSHFLYNDIDFLPSDNLYEKLMKIPARFLNTPYRAIIVPAFEYLPKKKITPQLFTREMKEYLPYVPTDKEKLNACMLTRTKNCTIFRDKSHLHEYLVTEWFEDNSSLLYELPCLKGDRQEPYILVQKSDDLPLYDERFVGYGWNKVQWIENLRRVGYRFYVFNDGFIIHCPHPESNSQKRFLARMKSVQAVWKKFLKDMNSVKMKQKGTPRC